LPCHEYRTTSPIGLQTEGCGSTAWSVNDFNAPCHTTRTDFDHYDRFAMLSSARMTMIEKMQVGDVDKATPAPISLPDHEAPVVHLLAIFQKPFD
jgi:hypothetical protein